MSKPEALEHSDEILENIFSFKGRVKRSTFWPWYLITTIAFVLMVGFIGGTTLQSLFGSFLPDWLILTFIIVFGILFSLLACWVLLALQVKRLHDRNISGWLVLLPFGPVVIHLLFDTWLNEYLDAQIPYFSITVALDVFTALGMLVLLVIFFLPGTVGPNRYGPDFRKYRIYCPRCGAKLSVRYHMIGDEAVCSKCKAEFTINREFLSNIKSPA